VNAAQRARLIAERKQVVQDRTYRLWCKDQWREFEVSRVPVEALQLNVDNRRFVAERRLVEEQIGRPLDPESNPADERIVISILLDQVPLIDPSDTERPTADTKALETDWRNRRQETPFWVRPDGTVRNGNRRLAVIKRLQSRVGEEGQEWVDAVVLDPDDIDEHELFKMEQREQLTENFKVRYTDINLLLALRDAAIQEHIDWADPPDLDRVAGALQRVAGGDKAYATIQLQAIRYMDAYLKDMDSEGEYHKLIRQVERFRDVGKNMAQMEADFPDDAADMLRISFAAIRSGLPHSDIRKLRRMYVRDRGRYDELLGRVVSEEDSDATAAKPELLEPDMSVEDGASDDADDEQADGPGPVIANYPKERVRPLIQNAIDAHSAAFTLDARAQLIQAASRLLDISDEMLMKTLSDDPSGEANDQLSAILKWADNAKRLIQ
jgi:hypothetical protein